MIPVLALALHADQTQAALNYWAGLLAVFQVDAIYYFGGNAEHWGAFKHMRDAIPYEAPVGAEVVIVTPQGAQAMPGEIELSSFAHPANAVYVFGADDAVLDVPFEGPRVYIPTRDLSAELWSHQAGAALLWDRAVRGG